MRIVVRSPVVASPRVVQVQGMFDLPPVVESQQCWQVDLPLQDRSWHLGLIVGPSGCGKSTLARHLFPDSFTRQQEQMDWPADRSVLDAFPVELSIKEIVETLSNVGFSSPPAWLRPFGVLSTGQQFRVLVARLLLSGQPGQPVVLDEFTSTVDRTVAQIGSAAIARLVRKRQQQLIAVTCHEDVEAWLQPDWVYRPAEDRFAWRCLQRRPALDLTLVRCHPSAWPLFAPHHYLSNSLLRSATCFLASWREQPVAFSAWLPFVGAGPPARREHRTVTLPDYQGVGIGNAVSATVASLWRGLGYRAISTTTHPGMIQARLRSSVWRMHRSPSLASSRDRLKHASTRLTAGFEYIGPALASSVSRILVQL